MDDQLQPHGDEQNTGTTINTDDGNDIVAVDEASCNLEDVRGLTLNTGASVDSVILHDENNPYSHALSRVYDISSTGVFRIAAPRMAQANVATQDVFTSLVDMDDVVLGADSLHYDSIGSQVMGDRFAEAYLAIVPEPGRQRICHRGLRVPSDDG